MYYVYILVSKSNSAMYIGVTNNLRRRMQEHIANQASEFTKKYHTHKLVYFEEYTEINEAIAREKQLKRWSRQKKNALVERENPSYNDLGEAFF